MARKRQRSRQVDRCNSVYGYCQRGETSTGRRLVGNRHDLPTFACDIAPRSISRRICAFHAKRSLESGLRFDV